MNNGVSVFSVVAGISIIILPRVLLVFPTAVSMTASESTVFAWCCAHQPSCRLRRRWNLVRPCMLEISCTMDTYLMRIPKGKDLSFGAISLAHQCLYFFYVFFGVLHMHCVRAVFVFFLHVIDSHELSLYFFTGKLRKDFSEVLVVGRSGGVQ